MQANSASVGDSISNNPGSDSHSNKALSARQRRLQTARDISQLLKQQWRPGLFALCLLIMDMIYWLFYFTEAKKLEKVDPTTEWFVQWAQCLTQQAMLSIQAGKLSLTPTPAEFQAAGEVAQRACASIAEPFVPNFAWAALSDMTPASFGIAIFIIFGTKLELWQDLRVRLWGSKNSTVFIMGEISKDTNGKNNQVQQQQHHPHHKPQYRYGQRRQEPQQQTDDGFYSDDLVLDQNAYGSRDVLASAPSEGRYGGRQPRSSFTASRAGSTHASYVPNTHGKVSGEYGGPIRKTSIQIEDSREPIYYRDPSLNAKNKQQQQQHYLKPQFNSEEIHHQEYARNVTNGSEPWPSWPSSTKVPAAIATSNSGEMLAERKPTLTVKTQHDSTYIPYQTSIMSPARTSPLRSPPLSPQKAFYNTDDLSAPPIALAHSRGVTTSVDAEPLAIPVRGSSRREQGSSGQHYRSGAYSNPTSPTSTSPTRAFSPLVPQKSSARRH